MEALRNGRDVKKILVFLLIFLVLNSANSPILAEINIQQSEKAKKELLKEAEDLRGKIKQSNKEIENEDAQRQTINAQIEQAKNEIDGSNSKILKLEKEIKASEIEIERINGDMKEKLDALKASLESIYKAGDASTIDIILSAKTFEDFLDKAELVRTVSESITILVSELKLLYADVQKHLEVVKENKKNAEIEQETLLKNKNRLQELHDVCEQNLETLKKSEEELQKDLQEDDAELAQIESTIKKYYEEQKRKKAAEEAERLRKLADEAKKNSQKKAIVAPEIEKPLTHRIRFSCPVKYKSRRITSGYYDTADRGGRIHGGIDYGGSGAYGEKVYAAAKGKVILAASGGNNGGWGSYVLIDHGDGYCTRYAHLSMVSVGIGETIAEGDVVGCVGNSGRSSGPHLHFESRLDGEQFDPTPYMKNI